MKLTKLFSHSYDEGGLITRNYVKVFTDSNVITLKNYYRYLYQNRMYSQLENFTNAMRMFGLFDPLKRAWNWVGEKANAVKYGLNARNTLNAAEQALNARESGNIDKSAYAHLHGYELGANDRELAYMNSKNPYTDYQQLSDNYALSNGSWGSAKDSMQGVRTADQMMEDDRSAMNNYLNDMNTARGIAADRASREFMANKYREQGFDDKQLAARGLIPPQPQQSQVAQPPVAQPQAQLPVGRSGRRGRSGRNRRRR